MRRLTWVISALIVVIIGVGAEEPDGVRQVTFGEGPSAPQGPVAPQSVWPATPRAASAVFPESVRRPTAPPRQSIATPRITAPRTAMPRTEVPRLQPIARPASTTTPTPTVERPATLAPQEAQEAPAQEARPIPANPTVIPDLIPPATFDDNSPTADAATATEGAPSEQAPPIEASDADAFTSRRETLGQPSTIVPTLDGIALSAPSSSQRHATAGWYKIVAGVCFLGAILMIGLQFNRRPRRFEERATKPAGGWLPPRREKTGRTGLSFDDDAALLARGFSDRVAGNTRAPEKGTSLWRDEPIARRAGAGEKPRRRSRSGFPKSQGDGFVFEALTPGPNLTEPGFHDEIERRVRKYATDITHDYREDARTARRPSLRDEEFSLVKELAGDGLGARDIARRLSIPEAEVEAVIRLR